MSPLHLFRGQPIRIHGVVGLHVPPFIHSFIHVTAIMKHLLFVNNMLRIVTVRVIKSKHSPIIQKFTS